MGNKGSTKKNNIRKAINDGDKKKLFIVFACIIDNILFLIGKLHNILILIFYNLWYLFNTKINEFGIL